MLSRLRAPRPKCSNSKINWGGPIKDGEPDYKCGHKQSKRAHDGFFRHRPADEAEDARRIAASEMCGADVAPDNGSEHLIGIFP